MSVIRMIPMLRILAAVATIGAVGAPAFGEPSKSSHQAGTTDHTLATIAHPASLTVRYERRDNFRDGRIASAVAPLDLRTLTLADFGDVDIAR